MILQIRCTKCNGQVIERDALDGEEKLCLNCGFGQIATIVPNEALADDAEDYLLRNRSDGWSDTYYNLKSPYSIRKERGQVGRTNRLGTRRKKQEYEQAKRKNKPKRIDTRQKVTKETIDTWDRIKEELNLHRKTTS